MVFFVCPATVKRLYVCKEGTIIRKYNNEGEMMDGSTDFNKSATGRVNWHTEGAL